jgi:hypothetical protein
MKYTTKLKLAAIQQWCDVEDKSTEFMIQFMQDACKVDHGTVMNFLRLPDKERDNLMSELNDFLDWFIIFENGDE